MILLPDAIRRVLVANAAATSKQPRFDPPPALKLFSPVGAATWLLTELLDDGDTLFGLADLGFQCPELGYVSLAEIAAVRLPFGLRIERDLSFASDLPLSLWASLARSTGSIIAAEQRLADRGPSPTPLPPGNPDG